MSTGKRLAKRSIIGTRVCAPGPDGLWYSGIIQDVKTPPTKNSIIENNNCINLTPDTKYVVRFDFKTQALNMNNNSNSIISCNNTNNNNNNNNSPSAMDIDGGNSYGSMDLMNNPVAASLILSPAQSVRRNAMIKEFREHELIGPGFRSILGIQLHPGQRVFLTYNGREVSGDVINHDLLRDEVLVKVTPIGYEEPLELKKRLEEVRLLESRRSARLADQERDTDFARLADMAGDRRRTSHSIDVPLALTQHNSRKRRPSYSQDERDNFLTHFRDDDQMDACNAALVLMSLSCSPRSPGTGQWNTVLGSSPGSSSASWSSSGTSSPPLSDDGTHPIIDSNPRIRTASLSTSDEGIVMDYSDEAPRKRRAHGPIFQCTWKGCGVIETTVDKIECHVRNTHLGPKKPRHSFDDDGAFSDSDHEEEFYYTEIEEDEGKAPSPPSPPTLSHRDMARPPHEDPEYQRQIVGNFRQGLLALSQSTTSKSSHSVIAGPINIPTSPLAHHNYTWNSSSQVSPMKHARWSPRPSTSSAPYPSPTYMHHQHHYFQVFGASAATEKTDKIQLQHTQLLHTQQHQQQHQQQQHHHQQHHPQQHHQQPQQQQQQQSQQNISIAQNGLHHHHSGAGGIANLSHSAPASTSHLTAANPNIHNQTATALSNANSQQPAAAAAAAAATVVPSQHLQSPVQQTNRSPQSPNRRTRGENKKCRKVYGMDHKDQWCTQCKWKKACSRFGD